MISFGTNLPNNCDLLTSGFFSDTTKAQSVQNDYLTHLVCNHEEADTRLIHHVLSAIKDGYNRLMVRCQDTDVLLLLMHFTYMYRDVEVWMMSGTAKQRKYYPIHIISQLHSQQVANNILGFHAFTGCDSTSSLTGFGKVGKCIRSTHTWCKV